MTRANFTTATPDEVRALDRLAGELRESLRMRRVASGLPVAEALDIWSPERGTRSDSTRAEA